MVARVWAYGQATRRSAAHAQALWKEAGPLDSDPFDALWEEYTRLREPGGLKAQVCANLDPAVLQLRRWILEGTVRHLLTIEAVRDLPVDVQKLALRRLARALWKGYLLALAAERMAGHETLFRPHLVDASYLRHYFEEVSSRMAREKYAFPVSSPTRRALDLVGSYEKRRLGEDAGELGQSSKPILEAVEKMVAHGYLMAEAQKSCLGRGVRYAEPPARSPGDVW